jgi:hypothetical protein
MNDNLRESIAEAQRCASRLGVKLIAVEARAVNFPMSWKKSKEYAEAKRTFRELQRLMHVMQTTPPASATG